MAFICLLPIHSFAQQSTEIDGRAFVCSQGTSTYSVNFTAGHTYSWFLNGGGNIVGASDTSVVTIFWAAGESQGPFTLTLMETDLLAMTTTLTIDISTERIIGLACNNDVQIGLDFTCEIFMTPDMILEDIQFDNDSYELTIKDPITKQIIPQGISGQYYLNRPLEVSVEHLCSGNSCWGTVIFEDKNLPALMCEVDTVDCNQSLLPDSLGFPLPDSATVSAIPDQLRSYRIDSFDPCSDITLSYEDTPVDFGCTDANYSGMLLRRWTATDGDNGFTSCTDTIYARRATLDDLIMPTDFNVSLVQCDSLYERLENGAPSPDYSGAPSGPACSNIYLHFDDVIVPLCGASFKVVREWTITDACADEFRIYKQLIRVSDAQAPIVTCPEPQTYSSDKYSCGAGVNIPLPPVDDCSPVTYEIFNKRYIYSDNPLAGPYKTEFTINDDNTFNLPELEKGLNWVVINVIDECGNETICPFQVEIIDDLEPTPICDVHTIVSLDEEGIAEVQAITFDDGSWDNCSDITFDARRIAGLCSDGMWRDTISFCCDDLDSTHMVFMRVTDEDGNSSSCMVEVNVQDKVAPTVICPADMTLDCTVDIWDLEPFGLPELTDNCEAYFKEDTIHNLDKCFFGTITRTFTGIDSAGNSGACSQILTFDNVDDPFVESDIIWPLNYIYQGCVEEGDLDPENLPTQNAYPRWNEDPCAHISFVYEDKFFTDFDTACYVIVRSWTVIDGCQWENPLNPGVNGRWYWNTTIKVYNEIAPTFDDGCDDVTLSGIAEGDCGYDVDFVKEVSDDCTTQLGYEYEVDIFNNDTIDVFGEDNDASGVYPVGTHRIIWYAFDGCANASICEQLFTILDDKAPTPYCINGITTVLMEEIGAIEVWASDLNLNSSDNCTAEEDLIFAFSDNIEDNNITFLCSDLMDGELTETVDIYVFDESGNRDFCTTTLSIQDNQNCEGEPISLIAGRINSLQSDMIPDVEVILNDGENSLNQMTTDEGYFEFLGLAKDKSYQLELLKNDDVKNGVSTLDLVLIQRHILGDKFDDPYKMIAADVNNTGHISATDLLAIRKLILGVIKEFPNNTSWRFIPKDYTFTDAQNPFPLSEGLTINGVPGPLLNNDFMGIKIGDVNGNVQMSGSKNATYRNSNKILVEDIALEKGREYSIPLTIVNNPNVEGLQFEIRFDPKAIVDIELSSSNSSFSESSFSVSDDKLTTSWNTNENEGFESFLEFTSKSNSSLSQVFNLDADFNNEIYLQGQNGLLQVSGLELEFRSEIESHFAGFNSKNIPNPFTNSTTIKFELPADEQVEFKVFDLSGNLITHIDKAYKKGANEIHFNNEQGISGILIYTLMTKTLFESKKMIVIE